MQVTIELPDHVADAIRANPGDVARRVIEGFAAQSYRSSSLTGWQVQQLLGLRNRFELDAFLKAAGVWRECTSDELERDFQNSRRASDSFAVASGAIRDEQACRLDE